jgi:hypothetical protein
MPTTFNGRTWPAYIPTIFKMLRENGTGAIRHDLTDFMIAPGPELNTDRYHKSNDCLVVYDLRYRPVFITEAKDDHWAISARLRYEADR